MPSVGMRRTTRVFGVLKGVDRARVLRSGRRLYPGSDDKLKQETPPRVNGVVKSENLRDTSDRKMYGIVYSRKRRRADGDTLESLDSKKFGIQFSRRQRRRKHFDDTPRPGLVVEMDSFCPVGLASFLLSVFGYMRKSTLRLSQLASFLSGEPVSNAFASSGIRFLQGSTDSKTGMCKIFGVRCSVPIFSLGFSAVPSCFISMHLRLVLNFKCLSLEPVNTTLDEDLCDEITSESVEEPSIPDVKAETILQIDNSENNVVLHPSERASKLAGRHSQYRNGLNSRGIQKRRRSSLRRKKARNISMIGTHKANGVLVSDLVSSRKNGIPFSSVVSNNKLRSVVQNSAALNPKTANPPAVEETRTIDTSTCSANLLVIDSDICYRVEDAIITLEFSESKEWMVTVKKDGLTRYTHLAQGGMRPCSFNRVTHDIIWSGDDTWRLEFPNRQDWVIFKDLYKECVDRNVPVPAPISKAIPVPRVSEVLGYQDSNNVPFFRPNVYISVSNDEVARALAKRSAIYDMDSEDEEWLMEFNSGFLVETEHLSEDNFELMIDAFEKALHCSPDDFGDEKAAVNLFTELGRREAVEAVFAYWTKKRKQRRSSLLRVFQWHQAKKAPLIPKPVLRKRRSFKRLSSQFGRGKQPGLLQVLADELDALDEQNAMLKVEAATTSAKISVETAILKRQRAKRLMVNADLAIYKAAMALRIAQVGSLENITTYDALTQLLD
ncbi:Enhancer of polycomb-like transcription factor protein [Euphorbia peplus]|nr:Enhancer of polycomb-like transcription factor protein [Euphorbia peplus]